MGTRLTRTCWALHSAGWSSLVARRAHNPKVVGSNPAPATKIKSLTCENGQGFFIAGEFFGPKSLPRGPFSGPLEGVREPSESRFPGPFYLPER